MKKEKTGETGAVNKDDHHPKKVYLLDVTNRDGVQTARLGLSKLQKTMINHYLNRMGIWHSEFGFPTTSHETNYLNANLKLAKLGVLSPIRLGGWIRALPTDVIKAFTLVPDLKNVNLSISTSDQMIVHKFQGKLDREKVISEMTAAVRQATEMGCTSIGVNAEDASRTDLSYLVEFSLAAREAGADRIRYCDTVGYDSPFSIYERIKALAEKVRIDLELHCHDDTGMAVANSIAGAKGAIEGGVNAFINTTINGIGERAGNADLVSVILALKYSAEINEQLILDERTDLSLAWRTAHYTSRVFGIPLPLNKPGVGHNMFAHASGIHADGVLKNPKNYELYGYEEVGRGEPLIIETGREILFGQYSGTKGFREVLKNIGIEFTDDNEASAMWELARFANVHNHAPLDEEELRFIIQYPEIVKEVIRINP